MRKLLKNPENKELVVLYKGNKFVLPAGGELVVNEELAGFWKRIHGFLLVKDADSVPEVEVPVELPPVVLEPEAPKVEEVKKQKGRPKLK